MSIAKIVENKKMDKKILWIPLFSSLVKSLIVPFTSWNFYTLLDVDVQWRS